MTHRWSRRFGGASLQRNHALAVDGDDVLLAGYYGGELDFGGGALPTSPEARAFLARLDPDGEHVFSRSWGSPDGPTVATALTVHAGGDVMVTGRFVGTTDLGGGPLTSAGAEDIFLGRFDAAGEHLASDRFGGSHNDFPLRLARGALGETVISGSYRGSLTFGDGPALPPSPDRQLHFFAQLRP